MRPISIFLAQLAFTTITLGLLVAYLRPHLKRILLDLCGTEGRAQFWTVFTCILLIGFPLIFGLGFHPKALDAQGIFFEIVNQVKWNLLGFILVLIGAGFVVSIFALVAPRPQVQ